jgi:PAS domain S-box-containing protein
LKTRQLSLQVRYLLFFSAVFIPIMLFFVLFGFFQIRAIQLENYSIIQTQTEKAIRNGIIYVENAYSVFDNVTDSQLRRVMEVYRRRYGERNGIMGDEGFQELKDEFGGYYDFYVIDRWGVITQASLSRDFGFDLSRFPEMREFLAEVRSGGEFTSPRITPEIWSGRMVKSAYFPLGDGTVLEIRVFSDELYSFLDTFDYQEIVADILESNPYLLDLNVYESHGYLYGDAESPVSQLSRVMVRQVASSGTDIAIEGPSGLYDRKYLYIRPSMGILSAGDARIVELVFNNELVMDLIGRNVIISALSIFTALFVTGAGAFIILIRMLKPIQTMITDIGIISGGHLDHPLSESKTLELSNLRDSIQEMVSRLKERMQYERNQAARIRESERNYREIIDYMQEGLYRLNNEGRIILVNPKFCSLLGWDSEAQVLGRHISDFRRTDDTTAQDFDELIESHGVVTNFQSRWKRRDGTFLDVRENAHIRSGLDSQANFIEGTVEDISEQLILENQLVEAQKMETLGQIAGGIAHDFNNVLAAISGALQMLTLPDETEKSEEYFSMIKLSLERARAITDRLVTFTRIDSHEVYRFDPGPYLNEVGELVRHCVSKNISVVIDVDDIAGFMIDADKNQFQQVILNLCVNAAAAMPLGGKITIQGFKDPGKEKIRINISDEGTGIPAAIQPRIFEPFFTTKGHEGTGLGLSVVEKIISNHNGEISFRSRENEGTVFTITLPAAKGSGRREKGGEAVRPVIDGACPSGCILVVEDEKSIREVAENILRRDGFEVVTAGDGEEALQVLQQREVRLILTDLGLPKLGGRELILRMKAAAPGTAIIIFTGYVKQGVEEEDLFALVDGVLPKPFDLAELLAMVRRLVETG